jgi:hypothetical protein
VTAALIINTVNEGTYVGDFGSGYVSTTLLAIDPAMASSPMARSSKVRSRSLAATGPASST